MISNSIAKFIHSQPWLINLLPKHQVVRLSSQYRVKFMQDFVKQKITDSYIVNSSWQRTMWGLTFATPLMNSAGMFKNGEGYDIVAAQGAGGYIGGTSTCNPRMGNKVGDIDLPFITLPKSHVSINYLGLPNLGDQVLSKKDFTLNKLCPLGWSVMRSPDFSDDESLESLVKSLWLYHDNPQIDFIEINESCPNIKVSIANIASRLTYIADNFLDQRKRYLPIIVKLSTDIEVSALHEIMEIMFNCRFDGINLGNTSTDYTQAKTHVSDNEQNLFDYFTTKFGGGIGGVTLKAKSFNLCKKAVEYRDQIKPNYEFHVIRSGGIESIADIHDSESIGVSMNQWYTGYFANYLKCGNKVYQEFF